MNLAAALLVDLGNLLQFHHGFVRRSEVEGASSGCVVPRKLLGLSGARQTDGLYPEGVESHSPGLPRTRGYPGWRGLIRSTTPEGLHRPNDDGDATPPG